jgi:predicted DNA-binding transcriptional regulator YafY
VNRLERLYAVAEELRAAAPRARTARSLAERFEVSVRTIERDLLALQEAGVPIWATPGPGGGYTVDPAMTLPPVNLTGDEAIAVALALARSGDLPFAGAARSALVKLAAVMAHGEREAARTLSRRIGLMHRRRSALDGPVARAVETAIADRRVLVIDYVDREGRTTEQRVIEPVGLSISDDGLWYLLGWCRLRQGARVFRVDRIDAATLVDELAPERPFDELYPDAPFRPLGLLE